MIFFIALAGIAFSGFAQNASVADPDPAVVGADAGKQSLKEISVDKFENEGSWYSKISSDDGYTSFRLFDGGPAAKEPLADEEGQDIPDSKVLGVKVDFLRRGYSSFTIMAAKPLPIEGVTKTVSFWVVGRNYNHNLTLLVRDYFGSQFEIYVGKLNFSGWKKMSVAIPPSPDGKHGIIQNEPHYGDRPGLKIIGMRIDCDPEEAYGSYYVYLDDLRAVTDLYAYENMDEDDMADTW
ncbi:MAG: flagellar filament outer layer protein FlaA [Spirochaetaceae bacterium]|nr:flagellar filament outer layer protein FlaA [Spirochaetaceae bacterium]